MLEFQCSQKTDGSVLDAMLAVADTVRRAWSVTLIDRNRTVELP